ncbi:hypothetical protein CR513_29462, partial [Mucuna pruriens]
MGSGRWCALGDFNSMKRPGREKDPKDGSHIHSFVWKEIHITLDMIRENEERLETWDNLAQWALPRDVSYLYLVIIRCGYSNWDP